MLGKVRRETLAEQVTQSLTEFIRLQDLQPGQALPAESKLAAEFGVSRQVIREALKALVGRGLIAVVNGKGAIVQPIDGKALSNFFQRALEANIDAVVELMEVRRGIEIQSAILAAVRRSPEHAARLRALVTEMREHLQDSDAYTELDVELHAAIASASQNAMLSYLVSSIRESSRETIREGLRHRHSPEALERVQVLHEALVAELERGDPEAAGRVMAQHFDEAVVAMVSRERADQGDAAK